MEGLLQWMLDCSQFLEVLHAKPFERYVNAKLKINTGQILTTYYKARLNPSARELDVHTELIHN
jgi:hypothetical protein